MSQSVSYSSSLPIKYLMFTRLTWLPFVDASLNDIKQAQLVAT
jgi:hypothetical protein